MQGSFCPQDLGTNVVAIGGLSESLDTPNPSSHQAKVDEAGVNDIKFRQLRAREQAGKALYGHHLVAHQPAYQVEIVDGRITEKGSIDIAAQETGRGRFLVAPNRFEDHRVADLASLDALPGVEVGRIIPTHEPDLQPDSRLGYCVENLVRLFQ